MFSTLNHSLDRVGLAAFALTSLVLVGLVAVWPGRGKAVAVIFPPWIDSAHAARTATSVGADLVSFGRYPFVVIVRPLVDGYSSRVLREGAIIVLGAGDRRGCFHSQLP